MLCFCMDKMLKKRSVVREGELSSVQESQRLFLHVAENAFIVFIAASSVR